MINLRYHIVSITAVFLALGIGLAMGAAFIDKATVDTLHRQLDDIRGDREQLRAQVGELQKSVKVHEGLAEDGGNQLLARHLEGVPVVVVAVRGIEQTTIDGARDAIAAAGAELGGTLWLTAKLSLDDAGARRDLGEALGQPADDDRDRLYRILSAQLGGVLTAATLPPPVPNGTPEESGSAEVPTTESPTAATQAAEPGGEPELVRALRTSGFIDFDPPSPPPRGFEVLPARQAHYLVVSGPGAQVSDNDVIVPLLRRLTESGPRPVVAAQVTLPPEEPDAATTKKVSSLVELLRSDKTLRRRLSTVDDLDTFAGRVAAVLALSHFSAGQLGHYGTADDADALVPPPVEGE